MNHPSVRGIPQHAEYRCNIQCITKHGGYHYNFQWITPVCNAWPKIKCHFSLYRTPPQCAGHHYSVQSIITKYGAWPLLSLPLPSLKQMHIGAIHHHNAQCIPTTCCASPRCAVNHLHHSIQNITASAVYHHSVRVYLLSKLLFF